MFAIPKDRKQALGSMTSQPAVFSHGNSGAGVSAAIESFIPKDSNTLNNMYRDIYRWDSVSGAACDLTAMIPFSDFSLAGINDPTILKIYNDSVEQLDIRTNIQSWVAEYLVIGKVVGSLVFNETSGIFTDLIVQDINACELNRIPLQGYDPKIDLKVPSEFRKFLTSKDPRDREARSEISKPMISKLLSGKVSLDPSTTLYLGRKTHPFDMGTSYLNRVIPFYMLEQILLAGTITGAQRRQRAITHIMAGDEDWDPTDSDLAGLVETFMAADLDPSGAIIATKNNINVSEVVAGGNFWKVTDEWDGLTYAKMRALGISESFLSREATFNNMDAALSVFMESLIALRYAITRAVFYTKLFPMLARVHRFIKRTPAELSHNIRITGTKKAYNNAYGNAKDISITDLNMPLVQWHKELSPNYDLGYLDILATIEERGVPIPLRTWASAGGISLDKISDSLDDDIALRGQFTEWTKQKAELEGGDEGGDADAWGSVSSPKSVSSPTSGFKQRQVDRRKENAKRIAEKMTKPTESTALFEKLGLSFPSVDKNLLTGGH